ncbi:MAG: epoxyqueuosine reductase [Promethearchaeota archaeon]
MENSKKLYKRKTLMTNAQLIKKIAEDVGFDLCGIAPVSRFNEAPSGFHPTDVYKDCKSVIVFAKTVPKESLNALSMVPYSHMGSLIIQEVDNLTLGFTRKLEELGIGAIPIPTDDPYEHWEPDRLYGRAILSLRHAGQLAGLGILGKNTLLINNQFGNMIQLGAILVNIDLEADSMANYEGCIPDCSICLDACPKKALDGKTVNQQLCRTYSIYKHIKGYVLKKCNICRKVCPHALGLK